MVAFGALVIMFCLGGSNKTYAYSATTGGCGVTSNDPHDFAGLAVGFGAVDSNNNPINPSFSSVTIRVNTIYPSYSNSDGSFNSGATGYYNLYNSNNSGQRTSGASFYGINKGDVCGMGTNWYAILGHSYQDATGDTGGNEWQLDCDFSYRAEPGGPQANMSKPYQQFDVYPSGTPGGATSGGYWTATAFKRGNNTLGSTNEDVNSVSGHIDAGNPEQVAPANGDTAGFVLVYHEPPPQCTGCGCPGFTCTTLTPTQTANCSNADAFNPGSENYQSPLASDTSGADTRFVNYSLPSPKSSWSKSNSGLVPNRTVVTVTDSSGAVLVSDVIGASKASSGGSRSSSGSLWLGNSWNYQPNGKAVYYTFDLEEYILAHNGSHYWVDYQQVTGSDGAGAVPCYSATCSLSVVGNVPNGPGNGVESNSSFIVWATVNNTGGSDGNMGLPDSVGGSSLSLTSASPNYPNYIGGIPPGSSETFPLTLTANSSGSYTISYYPDYWGNGAMLGFGSGCSASVDVFQYFNIQPVAQQPTGNPENPTTIGYTIGGYSTQGPAVTASTSGWLTDQPSGGSPSTVNGPNNTSDSYGTSYHTYSYSPPTIVAGDQYCSHVTINPANGWVDSGGTIANGQQASQDSPQCLTVVNEPYTHIFGADVEAGGGFGNSCTNTQGTINTYINNTNTPPAGSGTQFGAQALGIIEGLGSANLRSWSPSGPNGPYGLMFSNANNLRSGSAPGGPAMGGKFGLSNYCVPDYYSSKPTNASTYSGSVTNGAQFSNGDVTLGAVGIPNDTSSALYVNGNAYITGDITYNSTSWANVSDIPSFYLVVKGNIYIAPGVKHLDGVYIAQPNGGANTGIINSCSTGAGTYPIGQIYNNCKNQLLINGAFIAQQIFLDRAYSSLRYSQSGENPQNANHNCGLANKDVPFGATSNHDCAAEIFNVSPELYLAQPAATPNSGPTTGKFDDITSLSPVL